MDIGFSVIVGVSKNCNNILKWLTANLSFYVWSLQPSSEAFYFPILSVMAQAVLQSSPATTTFSSLESSTTLAKTSKIFGSQLRFRGNNRTHLRLLNSLEKLIPFKIKDIHATFDIGPKRSNSALRLKALREPLGLTQEIPHDEQQCFQITENGRDLFSQMKHRFLSFRKDKYLENLEHFQNLADAQAPKFMVVACADSRVCPSSILGFQPGEAFVIRNVANLVPPCQNGPSEVNAALEFAVKSLEVENILVVGHSCCGGIRALMSMEDERNPSGFIANWVVVGKPARLITKAAASNLSFDQQCRHCEKESINLSLLNLLTYPWIEEKVRKGMLMIHGGYYNFVDCTFERWTLDYEGSRLKVDGGYSIKNREFWG